jgi:hypothetical protein
MIGTVTIASVRAHGVRQLLVYCLGKREGDWPCHHQGALPIDRLRTKAGNGKNASDVAFGGKAEIVRTSAHVCF